MQTFQKPENALKRAEELQYIGQNEDALQILHSAIGHRTFRLQGWHILQEQIMLRYIEFCLHLEKLSLVKDGLHQYRIICQHGNIASLGKVIIDFRDRAEEKVRIAKQTINKENEIEENIDITEKILITSLDFEIIGKYERKLQNAFKICWETYKIILDILRATPKLEKAYHETARKALIFCKENNRLNEFKKLCDLLRNHYNLILKGKNKPEYQSLLKIEYHLETKILQLQTACDLCCWKAASNIAEDIYNINIHDYFYKCIKSNSFNDSDNIVEDDNSNKMNDKKKNDNKNEKNIDNKNEKNIDNKNEKKNDIKDEKNMIENKNEKNKVSFSIELTNESNLTTTQGTEIQSASKNKENILKWIAIFYERMADVLFIYDNELFHGLAWLKYCFHVLNYKKNISTEEKKFICTKSVLAVLSIPLIGKNKKSENNEEVYEMHKKMSQLLGHSSVPVKESLKNGLKVKNILSYAETHVQKLYDLIENKFTPLNLCIESEELLKELENTQNSVYIKKIKEVIFHKLILQLSTVYTCISIDYFTEHICPNNFLSWIDAEKILVDLVREGELEMHIDLTIRAIYFGNNNTTNTNKFNKQSLMKLYIDLQNGLKIINESIDMENEVEQLNMSSLKYEEEFIKLDKSKKKIDYNTSDIFDIIENEIFEEKPIEDERILKKIYEKIEEEHEKIQILNEESNKKRKETLKKQKEQEQAQLRIKMEQKILEEKLEKEKKEELAKKGEKQRLKEEKTKKKAEAAEQMLKEIKKLCAGTSSKILLKGKYLDEINIDDILNGYVDYEDVEQVQEKIRLKERNEIIKVRKMESKQVDHYFRAYRQEEVNHMKKWIAEVLEQDTEILLQEQKLAEEEQKANMEAALKEKEEYIKFSKDIEDFTKKEMNNRIVEFEKNLKAQKERLYNLLKEEKIKRAKERKEKYIKKMEAAEERKRKEEEEKRLMMEEMEKKRKEEEKRKKLDELSKIQREKELEIEMKLRRDESKIKESYKKHSDDELDWRNRNKPSNLQNKIDLTKTKDNAHNDDSDKERNRDKNKYKDRDKYYREKNYRDRDYKEREKDIDIDRNVLKRNDVKKNDSEKNAWNFRDNASRFKKNDDINDKEMDNWRKKVENKNENENKENDNMNKKLDGDNEGEFILYTKKKRNYANKNTYMKT